ncbi:glutamine synthetase [Escherichia coli]|nr:glutamine synthetase [Salmonella enterica]EEJ3761396.1 glutamine synthetase [Salmonella enterica subsp. enterica serovar Bredeney]EFB2764845.1 glutamine synthetase [Escherichia coli]EGF6384855.1 glutamine synthetase [Salmonella enterica subsp. enterica serovar Cubana]ELJ9600682.1 glutamine synthetase [Klebsiella pneumoniae]MLA27565.1 glutamine synthetase [Salmonella enterica subsp. enterica serovar Worthington]HBY0565202.1 glutamine synthetase [Klebsiella pneumoniae subsp. pneumoniae]
MNSIMKNEHLQNIRTSLTLSPTNIDTKNNSEVISHSVSGTLETDFIREVDEYFLRYPNTKHVDIYLNDLDGSFRGKRISVDDLHSATKGYYFPISVFSINSKGEVIGELSDEIIQNEPDRLCLPVKGTLRPMAYEPEENAQLLLSMRDVNNLPCPLEPRTILENVVQQFHKHGLYPVIAPEIEFYLINEHSTDIKGQGCYQMTVPSNYTAFIEKLEKMASEQKICLTGIVSEAEEGQFELNLRHSDNVVDICENVLAIRRLTSILAREFGYKANFMAKPFSQRAGNGLHFHISMNDAQGNNIFASPRNEPNEMCRLCLAGLLHLMPASVAIIAPGVNSFRRIRKNLHEPLFSSWGYNTRAAALRIPCSSAENRRIEYRLAGADANPYLVMATILTGMLYGLEKINDDTVEFLFRSPPALPLFQQEAIETFQKCDYLIENLGHDFSQQWVYRKTAELTDFERIVTTEESSLHFN